MIDILVYLNGYKTYIVVTGAVILWLGTMVDAWTWNDIDKLMGLLGLIGVGTMRSAIKKLEK